jgi:hypothetical protein
MIFKKRSEHTETVVPGGVFVPTDTGLAFTKMDAQVVDIVETVDGGGRRATIVLVTLATLAMAFMLMVLAELATLTVPFQIDVPVKIALPFQLDVLVLLATQETPENRRVPRHRSRVCTNPSSDL